MKQSYALTKKQAAWYLFVYGEGELCLLAPIRMNSMAHTVSIRFNFHIYETLIPFYWTVMVPATFTQLIIKSLPLVTSVIHLGSGSLILQPIIGTFNNTYVNLWLQVTLSPSRRAIIQGARLPRQSI